MDERYLFKAKRIDNGEWVEGYYTCYPEGLGSEVKRDDVIRDVDKGVLFFVDPSTICQCTGLKDKNGNLIWENDVVLLEDRPNDYEWKAVVRFGNPNGEYNWGWQLVPIGECEMNTDILLWIDMDIATCEVIGSAIDNPELLEVD